MKRAAVIVGMFMVAIAAVFISTGCNSSSKKIVNVEWKTDLEEVKKAAREENKNILLLFTTDDAEENCDNLKRNALYKKNFTSALKDRLKFVNIDVTEAEYQKTQVAEGASDKDIEAAQKASEAFNEKFAIVEKYAVQSMPSIYLLTKDGYVISIINYDPLVKTPEEYINLIDALDEKSKEYNSIVDSVKTSSGLEKVKAIDNLFSHTDQDYAETILDFAREVPELDKDNATGLVGKYEYQVAYTQAIKLYRNNDVHGAVNQFLSAIDKGHLDKELLQTSYYTIAYILSFATDDYDVIMGYLEKAYNIDTTTAEAVEIKKTMDAIEKIKSEIDNQQESNG